MGPGSEATMEVVQYAGADVGQPRGVAYAAADNACHSDRIRRGLDGLEEGGEEKPEAVEGKEHEKEERGEEVAGVEDAAEATPDEGLGGHVEVIGEEL